MKVLLLGAGASKPAGYPLASELMKTIERDAEESRNQELKEAWERWQEIVDAAPEAMQLLLKDSNPEVVLSLLDLCSISEQGNFPRAFRPEHTEEVVSASLGDIAMPAEFFRTRGHKWIYEAGEVRRRLLRSLITYFDWKHYLDSTTPRPREYLRSLLGSMETGDAVVTLNWDTTAERTLFELGRWRPEDGYGFQKRLLAETPMSERRPLPRKLSGPSEIVVLKLHGSLGWYWNEKRVYFDSTFLDNLVSFDSDEIIRDSDEPSSVTSENAVILHPSYLKLLEPEVVRVIWRRAERSLKDANEIEIWGYSLPYSDSAIRVLLNGLRLRLDGDELHVWVHVPDFPRGAEESDEEYEPKRRAAWEIRKRWRDLLGPKASIDRAALG